MKKQKKKEVIVKKREHKSLYSLTPADIFLMDKLKEKYTSKKDKLAGCIGTYQENIPVVWKIGSFRLDQSISDPDPVTLSPYAERCYNDVMKKWVKS